MTYMAFLDTADSTILVTKASCSSGSPLSTIPSLQGKAAISTAVKYLNQSALFILAHAQVLLRRHAFCSAKKTTNFPEQKSASKVTLREVIVVVV